MNPVYHNPSYSAAPDNQLYSVAYSRPPSNGHIQPTSHTLPPLNTVNNAAGYFQSSLMASNADNVNQNTSFPVYGPTASTYYQGTTFAEQPTSQPPIHAIKQTPVTTQAPPNVTAYTSAPNRLPELAPRTIRDQDFTLGLENGITTIATVQAETLPTHVVGSQGRRGILPSAAGRPVAVAGAMTNGQKAAPTPAKDDEGKFPCPYCAKNYLHAKHLKRHLLRHTGVRPYTCGLCNDTFSRSDILKRHFQKCSARRGNPGGESHLFHSRASKKREVVRLDSTTPTITDRAPLDTIPFTPTSQENFDITALQIDAQSRRHYPENSDQVSRASSVKRAKASTGTASNRTSLGIVNTSGYESASYAYSTGHVTPDSITSSGAATPYQYSHESRSNQLSPNGTFNSPVNGTSLTFPSVSSAPPTSNHIPGSLPHIRGGADFDWGQFSSNDDYGNGTYHSGTNTPHRIKSEHDFTSFQMPEFHTYIRTHGSDTN